MTLPTGPAVTFLFTDIEGSTQLERAVGASTWATVVAEHERLLRGAIETAGGAVVKTEGDAVFAAFADPGRAIEAIAEAQRAIAAAPWPEGRALSIRAGLHVGEGRLRQQRTLEDPLDYVGIDVNYTARIAAAANGGQVLLSDALALAVRPELDEMMSRLGTTVIDEGPRLVKDFDEPARLHRLVIPSAADDDRPLRTLEAPSNLPHETTTLVGREAEIERLSEALLETRILTLSGPGGSGKTRLAIGLAEACRGRFPSGVWFVDLVAVRDAAALEGAIASVVGVRESGERTTEDAVRIYLRDREVLVLLDNLEQLLPEVAARVASLARGAARLRLIVTSRELLRISGERGHPVPPLDVEAGIKLFEDRARVLRPDLVLTEESRAAVRTICERLGGLPLAIELAAARIRLFAPAAILERLGRGLDLAGGARDLPERQRTLRAAIDWSHDLLSESEQRLFRRLAIFAGGWAATEAASIVDADGDLRIDLLAGLESLVDKSLIRIDAGEEQNDGEARFSMHPLLREYAWERLEAAGERAGLEARHAAVYAGIAETAGGEILSARGEEALRRLDREQYNIRAVIDWSLRGGDVTIGLRAAAATWRWSQQRGRLREGRALLTELLDRPESRADARLRIAGLAADGGLAYWMEDFAGAQTRYEERLALAEEIGDVAIQAAAHYDIAFGYMVAEQVEPLRDHALRAVELYTSLGDEAAAARSRQALVLAEFLEGNYAAARDHTEETLAAFRKANRHFEMADNMTFLAATYSQLGDPQTAWQRMTEALRIFAAQNMASGLVRALALAAHIQLRFGDPELGTRIAGATLELSREKNVIVAPTKVLHLDDPGDLAAQMLGSDKAAALLAEGAATPIEDIVERVLAAPAPAEVAV
jgi:predicted ATPase/class 3 adenylate cyclase